MATTQTTPTTGTTPTTASTATQSLSNLLSPTAPASQNLMPQQTPLLPATSGVMDPLAFSGTTGTGIPTSQSFVSGTAGPGTSGVLGYGPVPGSSGGLIDLGGGMFAPTPGYDVSKGVSFGAPGQNVYLPPDYSPFGQSIGSVTSVGKITGWNSQGQPIYDTSVTNAANADPWAAHGQTTDPTFGAYQAPTGTQGELPTAQQSLEMALRGTSADPNSALAKLPPASMGNTPVAIPGLGSTPANDVSGNIPGGGTSLTPGGSGTGTTGSGLQPNVSPVNPSTDLRNMQITPGSMLDRFNLANQQFGTYASATNPQFDAALRDATRAAAGAGRLGSGMLRTSYGDLANQRDLQLQTERDTLFQNALAGSVQDAQTQFQDLLAEQSYQTGAQGQAFNQAVTAQQLQEALTSGAFNRALQMFNAGQAGNPAGVNLTLSQIWANQANAANQGIGTMAAGLGGSSVPATSSPSYVNNNAGAQYPLLPVVGGSNAPIGSPTISIDPITGQLIYGSAGY